MSIRVTELIEFTHLTTEHAHSCPASSTLQDKYSSGQRCIYLTEVWQLTWAYSPYNWPKTLRCMLLNHSHLITSPLKLTMNVDGWSEQVTWQTLPNFWPHTVLEEHCWTMVTKLHYSPKWPCIMAIRFQPSKKKGEIAYALGHTRTSHLSSQ